MDYGLRDYYLAFNDVAEQGGLILNSPSVALMMESMRSSLDDVS